MGRTVMIVLVAAAIAGCASGPVTGRVFLRDQPATPLAMSWESGIFGGSGTMSALMPDGERFSGKYVVVRQGMSWGRIEPAWVGDDPVGTQGDIDNSTWGAPRDRATFISAHLNKAIARLKGDRGTTMLCRFTLNAGEAGLRGGGAGECQTSKGAKITAQF
ncbi:MAG TPA: hypothetical protein VET45_01110 [Candidatus Binatia bacterium]|nr:hypothetical protein [Candidatus Binatia bacterium]